MITVKPHHFVDMIALIGDGRTTLNPHPYGHALHSIFKNILGNPQVVLCIEWSADDICRPCCHNINGRCDDMVDASLRSRSIHSKQEYNLVIDKRWSRHLGLKQNDRLRARTFCLRLRDCLENMAKIYKEKPAAWIKKRKAALMQGIAVLLKTAGNTRTASAGPKQHTI